MRKIGGKVGARAGKGFSIYCLLFLSAAIFKQSLMHASWLAMKTDERAIASQSLYLGTETRGSPAPCRSVSMSHCAGDYRSREESARRRRPFAVLHCTLLLRLLTFFLFLRRFVVFCSDMTRHADEQDEKVAQPFPCRSRLPGLSDVDSDTPSGSQFRKNYSREETRRASFRTTVVAGHLLHGARLL